MNMQKEKITKELQGFVREYGRRHTARTQWRTPLVGFASAGDPLFTELKRVVAPTHDLPKNLLENAKTVAAFFLPFDKQTVRSNIAGRLASPEWARAYRETNALIRETGRHMKGWIESEGYEVAVTPPTHNFDPKKLISDWSHRHVAYIAGLGTFGLNNMLITEAGCCGRFGSFVISLDLPPDGRPDTEACLYRHNGSCMKCVNRCVGDALFTDRFDRHSCYKVCLENDEVYHFEGTSDVCGKCVVGVPCSFLDPVRKMMRKAE